MKPRLILFIILLHLVCESVGGEKDDAELQHNTEENDEISLGGDEATERREMKDSIQLEGDVYETVKESDSPDGNAVTSSEILEEGGQEKENIDEYNEKVFEPGLSSQQSQLNVRQQTEDSGTEDQEFQESVPVGIEEPLESEQSTSVDSDSLSTEAPSDGTLLASGNVPTLETQAEEITPTKQTKWTQEELEEGDRLCAEALKVVDSKTESRKAFDLFKKASELGNGTALGKVAFSQLFGSYIPQNSTGAFEKFAALAEEGLPLGQMGLGFMYAIGVGVNSSQAKALVYYQFASLGGDAYAQMIMGYRYWAGVTLLQSCESGLTYYRKVAGTVAEKVTPHGGPIIQRSRLVDETEPTSQTQEVDEDLLQYYAFLADKGDMQAAVALGQLYYQGGRGIEKDLEKAVHFFSLAAREGQNAIAYAFLGKLHYEENSELEQDDDKALNYFRKSAKEGNPVGLYGMGKMYMDGRGLKKDLNRAFEYFGQAAELGWSEAYLQLGIMYYNGMGVKKDYRKAIKQFTLATQSGNILSFYNLAQMHAAGAGTMRACHTAVELYKNVAERGPWAKLLMDANDFYKSGDTDTALLMYMLLAEMGFEVAQSNAAYILDRDESVIIDKNEVLPRALLHWDRAAGQGYATARLKLGDYYYYGHGTNVDYEAAALHYRLASEQQHNAQAMFNLGYMHEHGLGMKEDFHLAKRFYDMAAESNIDAQAPTSLALLNIGIKFKLKYWNEYIEMLQTLGLDTFLGKDWDIYVMASLAGLLVLIILIYRARQQQELERSQQRQQQELERQRLIQEQQEREQEQQQDQDTTNPAEEPEAQNQDQ